MQVTDVFFQHLQGALAGRYQIERQIGRGATATVYLARDLKHDRPVAVKVMRPELTAALGGERFLREIKVAAGLQHPHILPLYDSGDAGGTLYYVMPFVEGESLRDRLNREPQLPIEDALRITREVADALAYAHDADIVHRDIKPENILLSDGHAVVADFGIARAISRAGGEGLTEAGVAIGTPIYMSPEQASGERHVDGRTDIYSLGCVLYEMLAGRPPFTGPTTIAVIAHRLSEPPDKLRFLRPDVPEVIEAAVERALADSPVDRFGTASEFEIAVGGHPSIHRPAKRRSRLFAIALVSAIAAAAAGIFVQRFNDTPALDESLFVVLPFEHRMGAAPTLLTGNQCEILLHDALARWNDIRLVPEVRVSDARARLAGATLTLDDALRIGRQLGAANLAWGEVSQVRDSIVVRAYLYDVRHPRRAPRERTLRLGGDLSGAGALFESLADSLLLGAAQSKNSLAAAMNTSSLAAWRMYDEGHAALRRWDLDSASKAFAAATERDPDFPNAQLMLAQTLAWAGKPSSQWLPAASRASTLGPRLSPRDRAAAEAIATLAAGQFPQACEKYAALVRGDSTDFAGWFGLAECNARDQAVVPDEGSPSRYRFRGNYNTALAAYSRALSLVPSVHRAFAGPQLMRLNRLMFTELRHYRPGYVLGRDSVRMAAFPTLVADTISFVPYPFEDVMSGKAPLDRAAASAATARTRSALRDLTDTWATAFPRSPQALQLKASILEASGEISESGSGRESAMGVITRARALPLDSSMATDLAVDQTRLYLKNGDFARARTLADSILDRATPALTNINQLAALAALTGRAEQSARFMRMAAESHVPLSIEGRPVSVALPVTQSALALLAYASLGGPRDSLVATERLLERQVDSWVQPGLRARVRSALLERPLQLAYPELGYIDAGAGSGGNYLRGMQRALVARDTAAVRRELSRIAQIRSDQRPGDVSIDIVFQEAVIQLAIGDSVAAAKSLDRTLEGLATLGNALLSQTPQAAGLARAMTLRARLAARSGDMATAARWGGAVVELWKNADPALQPVVQEMRRLTNSR